MIICISGLPGGGKSYQMVGYIENSIMEGRKVFCNFPFPYAYILEFDDIINTGFPDGSDLFIDEGNSWFRNRDWKSFPKEAFELFMHHRHFHMNMYIIAQNPETLDSNIRDIIEEFIWCDCMGFKWYDREGYEYKHAIIFKTEKYSNLAAYIKSDEEYLIGKSWEFKKGYIFKKYDSYYKFLGSKRKKKDFMTWDEKLGIEREALEIPKYKNFRHHLAMMLYGVSEIAKNKLARSNTKLSLGSGAAAEECITVCEVQKNV